MTDRHHLVVVGGGISGLAAAWEVVRRPGWRVTVLESSPRVGGCLHTTEFAGRMVDEGADAFLLRVPEAAQLCDEIGLDDLVSPSTGRARIWVDGALHPIPSGTVLGVPVDLEPLRRSGLVSGESLAKAEAEMSLGGSGVIGDVPLGLYLREHFGDEIVDRLVEPLVGGIYAGTLDEMSLDATTPQLAEAAHAGPSLRAGLTRRPPVADGPVFASPADGMGQLATRLAAAIEREGGVIRTDEPGDAWPGGDHDADAVVVAVPSGAAAALLHDASPAAAELISDIGTTSVVLTTVAHRIDDIPVPLDSSGFLVPRGTPGTRLTAASWSTTKWSQLARDDGLALLRVSLGHAGDPGAIDLDDTEVVDTISRDLATTMGITAPPVASRISRWRDGFPRYGVGHLDRVAAIEDLLRHDLPGVTVAGSWCRGVGVPACIRQGRGAARRAIGATG